MMSKTDGAVLMIERTLNASIEAEYVLKDSWFTAERMVKQLNQRCNYKGKVYTLPELQKFVSFDGTGNISGSLCVTTKMESL